MIDFAYSTEAVINASPEAIFEIVSTPSKHVELAGSEEVKSIVTTPDGPTALGTKMRADEDVRVGDGSMQLQAESVVVTYDAPKHFSFITNPVLPESVRRMQWWFHMTPEGGGTKVVHEVEVEFGDVETPEVKGLKDNYEALRATIVRDGMDKTLVNLKKMVGG